MSYRPTLFVIGAELEFFIVKIIDGALHVENADRFAYRRLGFSISQNHYHGGKIIFKDNKYSHQNSLVTDGTAFELHVLRHNINDFCYYLKENLFDHISRILRLDTDHTVVLSPYLNNKGNVVFKDAGIVYCSEKECRNAYSGETFIVEKKDSSEKVTTRTAGLHFHFSFINDSFKLKYKQNVNNFVFGENRKGTKHSDYLVQQFDKIYNDLNLCSSELSKKRRDEYQTLGIYRIRSGNLTQSGNPTLEYRQLDASMWSTWDNKEKIKEFLKRCENIAYDYLLEQNVIELN